MAGTVASLPILRHRGRGIVRLGATITVTAGGVADAAKMGSAFGRIVGVVYKPGTLDTGADIIIKDALSGAALITLTNAGTSNRFFRPTAVITTNAGVAVTAATTATLVDRDIYVAGAITVEVAQGGNATSGSIYVIVDEGGDGDGVDG